jgi:CTP:molybdopterin cytidylyltransferase MocA
MDVPERSDVDHLIDPQPLPTFARIRYEPPTEIVSDPADAAQAELDALALDGVDDGATVAVGLGSRGIHAIDAVVTAVVSSLAARGFDPVLVPAMGSHGGATADGQREVLESLGITEERTGAPIDARMDAAELDTVTVGDVDVPVYFATAALDADAVLIALGDMHDVDDDSIDLVIGTYRLGEGDAVAAAYQGKRGNPVLFDRRYFDALVDVDGDVGGRKILHSDPDAVAVETGDPGVLYDVDRPTDL